MPTLLILRHAKSAWPLGVPDDMRPLNDRGRRDAPVAGALLAEGPPIDVAYVSPALRTQQTFDLVAAQLPRQPKVRIDDRIYAAGLRSLLEVLGEVPDNAERALLVGHNPGMEMLASLLAAPDSSDEYASMVRKYPTAGLAEITLDVPWSQLPSATGEPVGRLVSFRVPRGG